jgi:hypothetical protein
VGDSTSKCWVAYAQLDFSILEVAVDPSYTIFFLETYQKRLIWLQQLQRIVTGCIFVLQAVRLWKPPAVFCSAIDPLSPYKKSK